MAPVLAERRLHAVAPLSNEFSPQSVPCNPARLQRAKTSYAAGRADLGRAAFLLTDDIAPTSGDLILARVSRIGQHKRLETPEGRRAHLHPQDEIIVAYGARYASDLLHGVVPESLEPCHLLAAGGLAGHCVERHQKMKRPTEIVPIGILADRDRRPLNLTSFALPPQETGGLRPMTIAVLGTSMNAGKTTTAASLVHGMTRCGISVAAAKATGTGAGCDRWVLKDAGASRVLDFTDAGVPSTYRLPIGDVEGIVETLIATLALDRPSVIVVEIADGLFQNETAQLLKSKRFRGLIDGVVLAAGDSMGAVAGVDCLHRCEFPVFAVSGLLTSSPLALEEARTALDVPVVATQAIEEGQWLPINANDSRAMRAFRT